MKARLDESSQMEYLTGMTEKERTERFKAAAESIGLTQNKLAILLKLKGGQPTVSAMCNGHKVPSEQLVAHIELVAERRAEYREAAGRG